MTDSFCGYPGDREAALVAYLYDDGADATERRLFEAHLATCVHCRDELDAIRGVRTQLARWAPPEPAFAVTNGNPQTAMRNARSTWWREIPAWAQVAAALLFLGVSAGIANLDVHYDATGLNVRTGWSQPTPSAPDARPAAFASSPVSSGPEGGAPWRADLDALERQLKSELRPAAADADSKELLRRVRVLLDESEKRQQRELALRVAAVIRDVTAQRQADLMKIDRTLGAVQNSLGVEVMKDRQRLNSLMIRTSGRQ
jgi:hypothetical protein